MDAFHKAVPWAELSGFRIKEVENLGALQWHLHDLRGQASVTCCICRDRGQWLRRAALKLSHTFGNGAATLLITHYKSKKEEKKKMEICCPQDLSFSVSTAANFWPPNLNSSIAFTPSLPTCLTHVCTHTYTCTYIHTHTYTHIHGLSLLATQPPTPEEGSPRSCVCIRFNFLKSKTVPMKNMGIRITTAWPCINTILFQLCCS